MARTLTVTRRGRPTTRVTHRATNGRIAQDVERIIKKAMRQTAAYGLQKRVKDFITDSIDNAKDKTETLHEDVANIAYRRPLTTLGLALLTGAAIALVVNKRINNHSRHRRKLFG